MSVRMWVPGGVLWMGAWGCSEHGALRSQRRGRAMSSPACGGFLTRVLRDRAVGAGREFVAFMSCWAATGPMQFLPDEQQRGIAA